MCELFAMASRIPATVSLSLEEFSKHGGLTNPHKDGWGIVYYNDYDVQIIREPCPAFNSPHMQFVKNQGLVSNLVISHIRKATMGDLSLRNTQPFARELSGRMHTFVHNGMLRGIFDLQSLDSNNYLPIGDTDSEYAFCILLERMRDLWRQSEPFPEMAERLAVVRRFANQIRPLGPANFIYCDGDYIMGHGDRRNHEDGMRPPGLYSLNRSCSIEPQPVEAEGLSITTDAESQDISLLASVPLTDESWSPLAQGEILVLHNGFVVSSTQP